MQPVFLEDDAELGRIFCDLIDRFSGIDQKYETTFANSAEKFQLECLFALDHALRKARTDLDGDRRILTCCLPLPLAKMSFTIEYFLEHSPS
jgi:hypothetical protein